MRSTVRPAPRGPRPHAIVASLLLCGCGPHGCVPGAGGAVPPAQGVAQTAPRERDVERRAVTRLVVGPRFEGDALDESSGLAPSAVVPGLFWSLNDSNNKPDLFALTADGRVRARVRVAGARNDDWEALAVAPCGVAAGGGSCVFVGDVGDNDMPGPMAAARGREHVRLYRVPEPVTPGGPPPAGARPEAARFPERTAPAVRLQVRYPDGPHDVEAMVVLPGGDTWLLTKRRHERPDGTPRPALVYAVPASAWASARRRDDDRGGAPTVTATLVDSLPVVPDGTVVHRVTDAALDPARRLLAVRTYGTVYLAPLAGPPWRVDRARRATACDVTPLREPQGEGLAFLPARGEPQLLLSSESNVLGPGGVAVVGCPAPR